jgi:hypothetical protein
VDTGQLIVMLTGAIATVVGGAVGLAKIYDAYKDRIHGEILKDKNDRIAKLETQVDTLRAEIKETVAAQNKEKDEWKALALGRKEPAP